MIAPHERPATGPAAALAARLQAGIPVIRTDRLTLRAPRIEDFDAYAAIACGSRGTGIGGPMSRTEAWADFIQVTGTWLLRGHGGWTITDRRDGSVLGFVLIGLEPGDREPELGYMLTADAEGRGVATEAAVAARDHGFGAMALDSLVSYVAPDNARSRRLAEGLGGRRDADAEAAFGPEGGVLVYRHTRPEARP